MPRGPLICVSTPAAPKSARTISGYVFPSGEEYEDFTGQRSKMFSGLMSLWRIGCN